MNQKIDLQNESISEEQQMDIGKSEQTPPNQTKGLQRNTIDKYYTKETIANDCLKQIIKHIQINTDDLIIEPSAGNGAFIKGIQSLIATDHSIFYDIEPENEAISKQDYLLYDYTGIKGKYPKIHIIGNPPFGRQSSLAIKFIKKSCQFCNTVSFILPKSFKKESLRKTFPLKFHLIYETDLPDKSFLVDGREHTVPCVFQIWEKRGVDRMSVEKISPVNFRFVEKSENPDISFRRVGVNAGVIDDIHINEKSEQSHYFIKFTGGLPISDILDRLSIITYEFNNTVGPRSISKQELIARFNPLLL
jgi:predicted RNA methylase